MHIKEYESDKSRWGQWHQVRMLLWNRDLSIQPGWEWWEIPGRMNWVPFLVKKPVLNPRNSETYEYLGGGGSYLNWFVCIDSIAQIDGSLDLFKKRFHNKVWFLTVFLPVTPRLLTMAHTTFHFSGSGYLDSSHMIM